MQPLKTDLSIYNKFDFPRQPAGVKYLFQKPEGIKQLDITIPLCEMLKELHQRGTPFYFTKENENCSGRAALGMSAGLAADAGSGEMGVRFKIFQEQRANIKIRQSSYYLEKGTVNYVVLSPLSNLTFEPDLLLLTTTTNQAEIVLRALTYSTGELYESKMPAVMGCSAIFCYPFLTGKVNYVVTGLSFGMKSRQVLPEGLLLISIPYNWIPTITQNLKEMEWVLPAYTLGREKFAQYELQTRNQLKQEFQEPNL